MLKQREEEIKQLQHALHELDELLPNYEEVAYGLQKQIRSLQIATYENLTPADKVAIARHPLRPKASDYIEAMFPAFMELHGDRCFQDDGAIVGGVAIWEGQPLTIIAQTKGKSVESNIKRNFGMVHPEGYRKAMRLAKQAEKFKRPIVMFVDTPGAYPGMGAEERGQSEAIASCLRLFSGLETIIITFVIGEGGSGGALAMSIGDRLVMLEHSIYSILSPEGFASILWKDASRSKEAADLMKLTAQDLLDAKIIDHIIHEPKTGIIHGYDGVVEKMQEYLRRELASLSRLKSATLLQQRYQKIRNLGTIHD
ncbi:MAG: acetyl-CoA carboxylase carboxyltransferase subunit alpha [Erysipelotrichaceae bacterium]